MADNRNTDWTEALRKRLESSELTPETDIWTKVESAAIGAGSAGKKVFKPVWWVAAGIAAAAAAIVLIPDRGNTVPELNVLQTAETAVVAQAEPESSSIPMPVGTVPPAARRSFKPAAAVPAADIAEKAEDDKQEAGAASVHEYNAANAQAERQSHADNASSTTRKPVEDLLFEAVPDEKARTGRKLHASLYATGLPSSRAGAAQVAEPAVMTDALHTYFASNHLSSAQQSSSGGITFIPAGYNNTGQPLEVLEMNGRYYDLAKLYKGARHHRPVSLGLSLSYPLSDKWFLESGLTYSFLRSEFGEVNGEQRLHFLGIPAKLGYSITLPSRMNLRLSAGAMAEKCLYGTSLGHKVSVDGIQLSAVAGASLQYRMGDKLGIFISPEWSCYFTDTELPTYRTEHHVSMALRLGLDIKI